jgi:hypothetical protein
MAHLHVACTGNPESGRQESLVIRLILHRNVQKEKQLRIGRGVLPQIAEQTHPTTEFDPLAIL